MMPQNTYDLCYLSSDQYRPLPEWAVFFIELGRQLVNIASDSRRTVIALALPTRAFACALTATGIVLGKATNEDFVDPVQLQFIRDLKPGTHIYVRTDKNKRLRGIFEKIVKFEGRDYVYIRTTGATTRGFPLNSYASRITVAEGNVTLPKHQQTGYTVESPTKFLELYLGNPLAERHILDSSFEALLVGKKSTLANEITANILGCGTIGKRLHEGSFQDILRVRQFSGANRSYRAQCISSSNITPEKEIGEQTPVITVFDGAVAYIKLGHKWRSSHQLVLLDRTENQFADASELLNQNYAYRLSDEIYLSINVPSEIEMMVYQEVI